ncbi:MAG: hypothetical protein A2Z28_04880 [Chloroflexi bacterium RBG_16_51_9]|nr:MAG: hypothetical protein A2Z28_04880 [Chloroflexi bacterium RBG_16_51_9]
MAIKVGINGFGRIGRQLVKVSEHDYQGILELVAINSLRPSSALVHLLKYDSIYGRLQALTFTLR